ncbi:hypothetical protein J15TS10_06090 [Paenibacillus woosongensis]|uniref:Uncharacterized protein n=1 Tax=Paenibacillus woosongensis TaxID=307580 RepID=A0ABQ4MLC9_9BACL|nr:hypothetical protein J15TS10_06090 [Paenibacillus woosongensis]
MCNRNRSFISDYMLSRYNGWYKVLDYYGSKLKAEEEPDRIQTIPATTESSGDLVPARYK